MYGITIMRRNALLLVASTVIGAASAQGVGAQQAPAADGGRVHRIDLIADLLYDDNVARSNPAIAATRGIKPSDTEFRPTVRLTLAQPFGRQSVFLNASTGYDFYRVNRILNSERISVDGGAVTRFGPCSQTLIGNYARSQSDLALLAVLAPSANRVQNISNTERVGLNGSCGQAIGFAPTFGLSEDWVQNSSQLSSPGSRTFSLNGGVAYRRPSFGSLSLFGSYSKTNFDAPTNLPPGVPAFADGFRTYAGGVTYTRRIGSRLTGTASISYTSLKPTSRLSRPFSGLTYEFNTSYAVSPRLNGQLKIARATSPSTRIGGTYSVSQVYSGEINYALGQRWNLQTGASRQKHDYLGGQVLPGLDLTKETVDTIFGSARYKLTRRISLTMTLTHENREASLAAFSYSSNRVGLSASTSF